MGAYFEDDSIIVEIKARSGGAKLCSNCQKPCPGYDTLSSRDFRFIPIWGIPVFFRYVRRRVKCPEHGIIVEWLPWADGKSPLTHALKIYLAQWARHLSWQTVAEIFKVTWKNVFESVEYVVEYGLKHRCLDGIKAIGVDEIQYRLGHQYLTLVYQIDEGCRRLLYIGKDRTQKTLKKFFDSFGEVRSSALEAVCSDMWKPFLKVIASMAPQAINILDRFHIMKKFNDAIDAIRRKETRQLEKDGYEPILKNSRWLLLKNKKNQTTSQLAKLRQLVRYNLKTVKAYLLREAFQKFWTYTSPYWAEKFLNQWTKRAMYSKIDEMKSVAQMLRRHQPLILNWFRTKKRLSNGIVEGFNNKAKLTMRKSYGFRLYRTTQVALYHQLGELPVPKLTHEFF
jgi:transposase